MFDIETAPARGFFWEMYETNIIEVDQQGYMLCFSAKWLGEKKNHVFGLPDFPGYKRNMTDDAKLVAKLAGFLEEADYVVAHNGDRFDLTTTNTRMIANGLPPLAPLKTVDTLKIARNRFRFLSNKLDDLGQFLNVGRKLAHTGKHLWFACMKGDMKAWRKMKAYNVQDVILLEKVYLKLRPWGKHPNINEVSRQVDACPTCGGKHLQKRGRKFNATSSRQEYQCQTCFKRCYGPWEKLPERVTRT